MGEPVTVPNQTIDPILLTKVVCRDQDSPDFVVTDWVVRSLSDKGLANPNGLLLVSGHGKDHRGERPWSVVLKKFALEPPVINDQPGHLFYWKRELALAQSGLLERLPGPVATPRCYHTEEWEDGGLAWLEFVRDTSQPRWALDQYCFAARRLGWMSGACFTSGYLPDDPWLCRNHVQNWMETAEKFFFKEGAWKFDPRVEKIFTPKTISRAIRLLDDRQSFIQVMEQLPRVFSHFDFSRRNLLIRPAADGQDELVALDWALAGSDSLGGDLASLVGISGLLFEIEAGGLPELESAVYPEYLAGLHDSGWDGDRDRLRLAYTTWLALWCGAGIPAFASIFGAENGPGIVAFNCQPEEMIAGWAQVCEFALERGEEARHLIHKLL